MIRSLASKIKIGYAPLALLPFAALAIGETVKSVFHTDQSIHESRDITSLGRNLSGPVLAGLGASLGLRAGLKGRLSLLTTVGLSVVGATTGSMLGDSLITKGSTEATVKSSILTGVGAAVLSTFAVAGYRSGIGPLRSYLSSNQFKTSFQSFAKNVHIENVVEMAKNFKNSSDPVTKFVRSRLDSTLIPGVAVGAITASMHRENRQVSVMNVMSKEANEMRQQQRSEESARIQALKMRSSTNYSSKAEGIVFGHRWS